MRPCMHVNILPYLSVRSHQSAAGAPEVSQRSSQCHRCPAGLGALSLTAASRHTHAQHQAAPQPQAESRVSDSRRRSANVKKNMCIIIIFTHDRVIRIEEIHSTTALLPLGWGSCVLCTWTGAPFGANRCRRFHDINVIHTYTYKNTNTYTLSTYTYTYICIYKYV
jgi:hypothetical protein